MAIVGNLHQLLEQTDNKNLKTGIEYLLNFDIEKEFADITQQNNRKVEIQGKDIYAIIQTYQPKEWDDILFEGHRKYIDIQCIFDGEEIVLHSGTHKLNNFVEYDNDKDVYFTKQKSYSQIRLSPLDACILFPQDLHAPCMKAESDSLVKKVVVKVKVG